MNQIDELSLDVDAAIARAGVVAGFLLVGDIENRMRRAGFESLRAALLRDFVQNESLASLAAHPHIRGYRVLHERFGISDPELIPSPESLYAVLFKHGDLKPINPIVDIYNYVALKHRLSCGAHDIDKLDGKITLRMTTGAEMFKPLGRAAERTVAAGEYAYIDGAGRIICQRECKQAAHTAVSPETRNFAIIVQGNAAVSRSAIDAALVEISSLLKRCVGEPRSLRRLLMPQSANEFQARHTAGVSQ